MIEQTLSIIKPDAVERNIDNKIKSFFQKTSGLQRVNEVPKIFFCPKVA